MANTTLSPEQTLLNKIQKKDFTVAVIGLGYVGLPLVEHLGHAGVKVIGVDLDKNKIEKLKKGESYIQDVKTSSYQAIKHLVTPTMDYSLVGQADIVNICVPTPLVKTKDPDVSYIISVCQELKKCLRPGQ